MTHTIVVGAGIAGLWIALRLAQSGERVTVLESYGVPGGRIHTSKYGYELGAGRIHRSHRRMRALMRNYHLRGLPIPADTYWRPVGGCTEPNYFESAWPAIQAALRKLPAETLATHTIRELLEDTLGADKADALLLHYPYRTEVDKQRADIGLDAFSAEMASSDGYVVVQGGMSGVVRGLVADLKAAGGTLEVNTHVTDVKRIANERYTVTAKRGKMPLEFTGDRVVLALHATALRAIPATRDMPALQQLGMARLTRIYAQYPGGWAHPRIVTNSPLRYIIPVDPKNGVVMISYTDDRDTAHWKGLQGDDLKAEIQKQVHGLFPYEPIPEPEWVRPAEWIEGTTYWKPGRYAPAHLSRAALQPRPADMPGLYCCGESFSVRQQAWVEGALEHAEQLWNLLQRGQR